MQLGCSPVSPGPHPAVARAGDCDVLDPCLGALPFLDDGSARQRMEIGRIRGDQELLRAPLVVGVVMTCKPNGLGDLFLTLKDLTGTIGASVHKKVLLEGNIAKGISVGCVIVLKEVAVFRPSRSGCYLNVTKENVVKILPKGCQPPSMQVISSNTTECLPEKCTETGTVSCHGDNHIGRRDGTEISEGTTATSSQQLHKIVNTGRSSPKYGRSNENECSTANIMMKLLGDERTMPRRNEATVSAVASNSISRMDTDDWCHSENHQELRLDDDLHQQTLNTSNIRCAQPGLGGNLVPSENVHSTQVSASDNLTQLVDSERVLPSSKKMKGDVISPYGNDATLNNNISNNNISMPKLDIETMNDVDNNLNIQLDMAGEFHGEQTLFRRPDEHEKKDFDAANASAAQLTQDSCWTSAIGATIIGEPLLSIPKIKVSVAPVAEWTDEQLSELFADY